MTKQIFMDIMNTFERFGTGDKLRSCKAVVETGYVTVQRHGYKETVGLYMLKSYSTYVACINPCTLTMYVFDYWSSTTCQHVAKFAADYKAKRIVYLYKRSDNTGYIDMYLGIRRTYKETITNIIF